MKAAPRVRRFIFTIASGAVLLFLVQPMVARAVLPWFGGSAAVWTTCQLFFQLLLLGGYAWTHGLVARLTPRKQVLMQRGLVIAAALSLVATTAWWGGPVIPGVALRPLDSSFPIPKLLLTLLLSVGLPYFALATTGPLLQAWASSAQVATGSVYRLYALSNAGSLIGLLVYPFLLEPLTTLRVQGWLWTGGFATWAVGLTLAGRVVKDGRAAKVKEEPATTRAPWGTWLALSAAPVVLLLAVTTHLTQEVAPIPFLWVLPLVAYLLSFIVTFESERWYRPGWVLPVLALLGVVIGALRTHGEADVSLPLRVAAYLAFLFVACVAAHGELARSKPAASGLTGFYAAMATGGALGGVFAGVVAPALFSDFYELELGVTFLFVVLVLQQRSRVVKGVAVVVLIGVVVLLGLGVRRLRRGTLESRRDFFGVVRVTSQGSGQEEAAVLMHGSTVHGVQFRHYPTAPTSYYAPTSGIGKLLTIERPAPRRVGVVGLGIGTLAAYGRVGDVYRFYEISSTVSALAQGEGGHFSFLHDTKATVEVALGDARTSLEQEAPQAFNVLVLDAFSSDAVPVHLLTREAMTLYLRHLARGGVLAYHLSNRSLDLVPAVCRVGRELGLSPIVIGPSGSAASASLWLMLVRSSEYPAMKLDHPPRCDGPLWTDDFSALWPIVRWD